MSMDQIEKPLTTLERYAPADKAAAYEKFLTTDLDLIDIAISIGVPKRVVAGWAKDGGWARRKEELELELMRAAEGKYRNFLIEHRLPTIERHMALARSIEDQIAKLMKQAEEEGKVDSKLLRSLSETLVSVTGVSARAVGLAEKTGAIAPAAAPDNGKRALVAIGIAPRVAQDVEVQVVEVSEEGEKQ